MTIHDGKSERNQKSDLNIWLLLKIIRKWSREISTPLTRSRQRKQGRERDQGREKDGKKERNIGEKNQTGNDREAR